MTFAIGAPFLVFDLPKFMDAMRLLNQSMEIGTLGLEFSRKWLYHLEYSLRYGVGVPLLVAGVAGMAVILVSAPRAGIVLLTFPIAYYIVAGSVRNLFFRYAIPLVPFLCIAAARLVTWGVPLIANRLALGRHRPPMTARAIRMTVAAMAALVVLPSALSVFRFDRIISRTDNRVVVARWFDQNVPSGSSVLMSGSSYGYVQFTRAMDYKAWVWDRQRLIFVTDLDRRPGVGKPDWILLQESLLPDETQQTVKDFLKGDYTFVEHFQAYSSAEGHVFDMQDQFFLPFAGFHGVERPGPNYSLYKRGSSAP